MSASKIDTTRTDRKTAEQNRRAVEDGLAGGGRFELPAGLAVTDRQIMLRADASHAQLTGLGRGRSALRNLYDSGPYPYGLWVYGTEITDPAGQGAAVGDLAAGALATGEALKAFAPGTLVYVTQGLSYLGGQFQEAMTGEYRRVAPGGRFDRPISRDYLAADAPPGGPRRPAYAVPVQAVEGLLVADLTIAQPVNGAASPLMLKYLYGCRFERVGFGLPDEIGQRYGLNTSADVEFRDCLSSARLEANTSHGVRVVGGQLGGVLFEESCDELLLRDVVLAVSGQPWNGLECWNNSTRLLAENVDIYGAGQWYAGGTYYSVRVLGDGCVLRDVRDLYPVANDPGYSQCQLGGNGLVVERFSTPMVLGVDVVYGTGIVLDGCRACGWLLRDGTAGVATDCPNMPVQPQIGGDWRVR